MSTLKLRLANHFAKKSCPAWQPRRAVRKINRKLYRFLMEFRAKDYPYADPDFAPWPESDGDFYTLITDSANFVIRRSTSYVAWLMKRHCGEWPKLPVPGERKPGEHKFDARHWDEILEFNGWQRITDEHRPVQQDAIDGIHYVGIMPNEGEFGQLLWFVGVEMEYKFNTPCRWHVWTYEDFRKKDFFIPASKESGIIWYREPTKN